MKSPRDSSNLVTTSLGTFIASSRSSAVKFISTRVLARWVWAVVPPCPRKTPVTWLPLTPVYLMTSLLETLRASSTKRPDVTVGGVSNVMVVSAALTSVYSFVV